MSVTLSGRLVRHDHSAASYDDAGRLLDAHSIDISGLTLGAEHIGLDLDHDGDEIGSIVHLERNRLGDIDAVAVSDLDDLAELDDPIYYSCRWSATTETPGQTVWFGRNPVLLSVALTYSPAQLGCPPPLTVSRGDVRCSGDRAHWPVSWRYDHKLLERASRLAGTRSSPTPLRIHDLDGRGQPIRQHPAVRRAAGHRGADGLVYQISGHLGEVLGVT